QSAVRDHRAVQVELLSCVPGPPEVEPVARVVAPAIVALVGGTVQEAVAFTRDMGEITTTQNPNVTIPALGFEGIPTGIDVRKVLATGILPVINTAIAHREAGIGMIGAGITHPPAAVFEQAARALARTVA
ncbi:hypothetical protein ACWCRC_37770, partial [Streptomyces sp. NPDC001940]